MLNNLGVVSSIRNLPNCIHLSSLGTLILFGCLELKTFPKVSRNIKELFLYGTAIKELPSSIEQLSRLVTLNLENCSGLACIPSSICKLKSLEKLNLSGCSKIDNLPDDLGNLEALKELKAKGLAIREVPSSFIHLNNLGRLSFERCTGQAPMDLLLPPLLGLRFLTDLDLTDCGISSLPESLGQLSSLKILFMGKNNFESIPTSIKTLYNLFWHFNFINCFRLDQNEVRKIIEDVLLKIQLTTNLWREISFEVSFSFYMMLATLYHHVDQKGFCVGYKLKLKYEYGAVAQGSLMGWHDGDSGLHYVESDHVFLGYDFNLHPHDIDEGFDFDMYLDDSAECSINDEISIEFYLENYYHELIECCEVKKCGVQGKRMTKTLKKLSHCFSLCVSSLIISLNS
ncbi:hypothetical protein ACOSP7_009014 [Xanthoceras sorbifolium]